MRSRSTDATATRWPGALSVFPSSISRRCFRRSFSTTIGQGTSEQVPRGLRCGQNADECEARDEGRSFDYDAEERDEAGAAFCRNPDGTGLFGRSALSRGSPMGPTIGFASLRASHPEKPPSQPCGTRSGVPCMIPAVEIVNVARRFGAVQALAGVDLAVEAGEFFGLLGPNGAGKTTLISILAGLIRADAGAARVLGHDVVGDYRNARRLLGVVPQELVFDPFFTVRETLEIQSGYFGIRDNDDRIDEILHHLDLTARANANMRALSGGMKRRVLIGQALVHKPPVIVLDEPTAGVDVELRQSLWAFIRKLNRDGHTIILTTHYLEEAEALCGRIAMLKAGKVVALDTKHALLSRFAGITVRLGADRVPAAWRTHVLREEGGLHFVSLEHYADLEMLLQEMRSEGLAIR